MSAVCSLAGVQAAQQGGACCLILKTTPLEADSNEADLHFYPLPKASPCSTERERAEEKQQRSKEALETLSIVEQEQQQVFG